MKWWVFYLGASITLLVMARCVSGAKAGWCIYGCLLALNLAVLTRCASK
jgi:hypothetical protein